jgi:hypothetical protein
MQPNSRHFYLDGEFIKWLRCALLIALNIQINYMPIPDLTKGSMECFQVFVFLALNMCLLPGGPGKTSIQKPA